MRFTVASLALAVTAVHAGRWSYDWVVSDFAIGCAKREAAGCSSRQFTVTGEKIEAVYGKMGIPPFQARCAGVSQASPYAQCTIMDKEGVQRQVSAWLLSSGKVDELAVSYVFPDDFADNVFWNLTGYATQPVSSGTSGSGPAPASFCMTPVDFRGSSTR